MWHHRAMPKALPVLDTTAPVCCAPLAAGAVGADDALQIALRLKALADPVRVRLLSMLLAQADTGVCTCDLAPAVGVSEATVSHHLKQLRDAGLVEGTRSGTNVFYRPRAESLGALCRVLDPTCC
jgi:ArsR family transcriptional regulator, arsenate/arsenite/antimonite-responsive transcriptional repressor